MQILNTKKSAIYIIVAVLVVSLLIGSTGLLLAQKLYAPARHPVLSKLASSTSATDADSVDVKEDGLEMSMRVTPGPYFLGELVLVHLALTNHTHPTLELAGQTTPTLCSGSSLFAMQTGGTSPRYIPYTMPIPFMNFGTCGQFFGIGPMLAPGQTVTSQTYILLISSGKVTLSSEVFFSSSITPGSELNPQIGPDPLAGHLPTLSLSVTPQVPANRVLATQQEGSEVVIHASPGMQLVYQTYVICQDAQQHFWPAGTGGHALWNPLSTNMLSRPDCTGANPIFALWKYAVGAEGYEVVQGQQGQYTGPQIP